MTFAEIFHLFIASELLVSICEEIYCDTRETTRIECATFQKGLFVYGETAFDVSERKKRQRIEHNKNIEKRQRKNVKARF